VTNRGHTGDVEFDRISVSADGSGQQSWLMALRAPHPGLAADVSRYCGYVENAPGPVSRREVPNGRVSLVISFGDPIDLLDLANSARRTGRFTSFVTGLGDGYAITEHAGRQQGIQIDLAP